ncbi:UNVERIFIED_CONTAM: hypothetical protein GTU68_037990, partial [Idotea baltica]|nr:hypothetical protein [Idotea baltica]
ASHNPYEDNGIKFFGADGFKLADSVEDEIASFMEPGKLDGFRASPENIGKMYRVEDAVGRYAVYLKTCMDKNFKLDGVKIVVDSANGAAYRIARILFTELGADLITIGDKPNGKNINLGCGSTHPELLAEKVVEHGAFCGIAFDGDADRIICCDEKGGIIDGDLILAICASALKKSDSLAGNGVVGTVMTNLGLEKSLEKKGIKLYRAGVGDRYVLAEMKKNGVLLGGEQSGHIIFLEHNTTGDALLSALMLLSNVLKEGKPLSEYHSLIERFPQQLINIAVKEKKDISEVPELEKVIKETEAELEGKGRLLFRYSGTEQKARVMVEADDEQLCQRSAEKVADVVRSSLGK